MFFSWELFTTTTFVAGQFMVFVVAITSYRRKMLLLFYNLLELTLGWQILKVLCVFHFFWGIVFFHMRELVVFLNHLLLSFEIFFAVFYWRCSTFIRFFCDLVDNLNHFAKKVGDFFFRDYISFCFLYGKFFDFFGIFLSFFMIDKGRVTGWGCKVCRKK